VIIKGSSKEPMNLFQVIGVYQLAGTFSIRGRKKLEIIGFQ
jgi:hypothetical protein